jgi:hypothetical protein
MKKITIVVLAMLALTIGVYAQSAPTPAPATSAPTWEYNTTTDKMTGHVFRMACLKSSNELKFNPPYDGGSRGEICLGSYDPHKKGVVTVSITKGQIVCQYAVNIRPFAKIPLWFHGCELRVKFDDGGVRAMPTEAASNGSTNSINIVDLGLFFNEHDYFLKNLKKSKHVMLEAIFYQESAQVMEFDTSGLVWEEK